MLPEEVVGAQKLMDREVETEQENNYRNYLHRVLTARFDNVPNEDLHKVNVISIGADCLPRTLFAKWGIRRSRSLGEKTLPFDLAYSLPIGVLHLLNQGLDKLTDPRLIQIASGTDYALNTSFGICFNHEVGEEWRANNFEKLRLRYNQRIEQFEALLGNGLPTIIVMNYTQAFDGIAQEQLVTAASSLAKMAAGNVHLLCVLSEREQSDWQEPHFERIADGVSLTRIYNRTPSKNYQFYDADLYTSPQGLAFELGFLEPIRDIIAAETGVQVSLGEPAPMLPSPIRSLAHEIARL